jgi:NADH:ubiquinone reductase (H+-translocating)
MAYEPHVVILGAGFAGAAAMKELRKAPVRITVINKNDYQAFQPLLYQVATDVLSASEIGFPVRQMLHGHRVWAFHQATVTGIDLGKRQVTAEGMEPIGYDYLVVALGAVVNFFGTRGAAEHAFPLYTLGDAERLKTHVLEGLEAVDRNPGLIDDGALRFCVVGGGPTGVEVAGAMAELLNTELRQDYPNLPLDKAEIHLYEAGPHLLAPFKPALRDYAKRALEKLGVRVHLGEGVVEVESNRVHLKSGAVVKARTLVWGAGLRANPLVASLGIELVKGRVPVNPDLSLKDHPEVFAAGDVAIVTEATSSRPLPQLGSVAKQAGEHVGRTIARRLSGKGRVPFRYRDRGTMATIGRGAAVAELPAGFTLTGPIAWLGWLCVHLVLLSGGVERSLTLREWGWNILTRKRSKRIVVDVSRR